MKKHEIKTGDIWELGAHRLACGSSTDPKLVDKLVGGGGKIRMICCDPPYGVAYVENKKHFKETIGTNISIPKAIANDELQSDEQYEKFTKDWLEPIVHHLAPYNSAYVWNSDLMLCALRQGMKSMGWYYSQMIIWIKQSAVVGRKDYLPQHELCVYGWYGKHKMEHPKGKSIMFHPRPSSSKMHPTQKPVGLIRRLILDATKIGDIVYDNFGGSGTTLIACEQTKRRCLMIEMDPEYVANIIARWEKLTGQIAKKL